MFSFHSASVLYVDMELSNSLHDLLHLGEFMQLFEAKSIFFLPGHI